MAYMKKILLCMMCIGVVSSLVACTESSNMNSATDGSKEDQMEEMVPDDGTYDETDAGVLDDAGDMLDDVIDDAEGLVDDVKDDIDSQMDDTVDDLEK